MVRFTQRNSDMSDNANDTTILGWVIAPAMLLATLYISGMGPLIGSFGSSANHSGHENASSTSETATSVTQVFSVRYID